MAERELGRQLSRARHDYVVERLEDADRARAMLRPRLEYTAYALAQLEPGLIDRARWYLARGDTGQGLVVHSRGGLGDATLVMGDPGAIAAILLLHPGAPQTYATFQPQHGEPMRGTYRLATLVPMLRMVVRRDAFRAVAGETVPLTGAEIRKINRLYGSDGGPSYYAPEHIDAGVYRGVMLDGRLVAIAGTHVVSYRERVAVVGNVFTHPAYRSRGFGRLATSAVTEALFRSCDDVVLTVDPGNTPAIRAYERLGYREACQIIESTARRLDVTGARSALRRAVAAVRGRRYGGAFVSIAD